LAILAADFTGTRLGVTAALADNKESRTMTVALLLACLLLLAGRAAPQGLKSTQAADWVALGSGVGLLGVGGIYSSKQVLTGSSAFAVAVDGEHLCIPRRHGSLHGLRVSHTTSCISHLSHCTRCTQVPSNP
jgi:hypothetical protein